ncbi:hypothetical protein [Amycolatopsis tolypomycina]|uniref:hypothetical protein n=1 Tax=Amycolatopsis tolypomycina TaxID=208445 RepID=UPI0033A4F50C
MTRPATRRRILTSDRLYTAGILIGAALVPHLAISIAGDWPAQPFSAHVLAVLLLFGGGWKIESAETQAERANGGQPKVKKSKKSKKAAADPAQRHGDMESFEDIVRHLRKEEDEDAA